MCSDSNWSYFSMEIQFNSVKSHLTDPTWSKSIKRTHKQDKQQLKQQKYTIH